MGIVSYQGLIYIVGGCTHSRRHMQVIKTDCFYVFAYYHIGATMIIICLQELVSYNPVTSEWVTRASMLVPRWKLNKKITIIEDDVDATELRQ